MRWQKAHEPPGFYTKWHERIMTDRSPDMACVAQIVPNFRVRTIPVLGTMPAIFGLAAVSYILCQLAGAPFQSEPIFRLTEGQYETQLQRLTEREGLVYGNSEGPAVDLDDVSSSFHVLLRWPRGPSSQRPAFTSSLGSTGSIGERYFPSAAWIHMFDISDAYCCCTSMSM